MNKKCADIENMESTRKSLRNKSMTKAALESESELLMRIHNKSNNCVENKNMDKSDVSMLSWTLTKNGKPNNKEEQNEILSDVEDKIIDKSDVSFILKDSQNGNSNKDIDITQGEFDEGVSVTSSQPQHEIENTKCDECKKLNNIVQLKEITIMQQNVEIESLKEECSRLKVDKDKFELLYSLEKSKVEKMKECVNETMQEMMEEKLEMKAQIEEIKKAAKYPDKEENIKSKTGNKEEKVEEGFEGAVANMEAERYKEVNENEGNKYETRACIEDKNKICTDWVKLENVCEEREKCKLAHPGICQKKTCKNKEVHIGIECGKMHIKPEDLERLADMKEIQRQEKIREQGNEPEYCIRNKCAYRERCKKIHVSLREYKKTKICKFYDKGYCYKRNRCEYRHEKQIACRFYRVGSCLKGIFCEYQHEREETTNMIEESEVEKKVTFEENAFKLKSIMKTGKKMIENSQEDSKNKKGDEQNDIKINEHFLDQIEIIIEKVVKRELKKME